MTPLEFWGGRGGQLSVHARLIDLFIYFLLGLYSKKSIKRYGTSGRGYRARGSSYVVIICPNIAKAKNTPRRFSALCINARDLSSRGSHDSGKRCTTPSGTKKHKSDLGAGPSENQICIDLGAGQNTNRPQSTPEPSATASLATPVSQQVLQLLLPFRIRIVKIRL